MALVALAGVWPAPAKLFANSAPDWKLPRHDTGQSVQLADLAGQVLVLDFFAYWCAPCRAASKALEADIQKFYAARGGNRHGIPVRVISINIEQKRPELTDKFISTTGASLVLDDFSASLLKQFDAAGIPYLVIIDGSRSRPDSPLFTSVYHHAGFEGADRLREIIDGIGPGSGLRSPARPRASSWLSGPMAQRLEADSEITWTSDMLLTESGALYEQERGGWRWDASLTYASFDLDYRPFRSYDLFGFAEQLHEERYAGQATVRPKLTESLAAILSGGAYDGFQDYRRVWLNNYYRQQYHHPHFPPRPGYREAPPDPHGWNASAGVRWEYLPATGFLEARGGYNFDQVAPGYMEHPESGGIVTPGRARLSTLSLSLSSENVLGPRLRALNEARFSDTTAREPRVSWQGSLNWALSERWVARSSAGYTTEAPRFEAFWLGTALEFELTRACTLIASGHYYRDTGEILDPQVLSSAAPGLESYQASLGVRFTWARSTIRFSLGPYFTHYAPVAAPSRGFSNLYRDRHWGLAQAAISVAF